MPLFNQKKRTRQPLTSNPLKNEPGSSSATHDSFSSSLGNEDAYIFDGSISN